LLIGGFLGTAMRHKVSAQFATLRIQALVTSGSVFRIYYNGEGDPHDVPISSNQWAEYAFKVPARITALRFDLTDASSRAVIRSIKLTDGAQAQEIPAVQLLSWLSNHIHVQPQADGTVVLTNDVQGAYMMSGENLQVGSGNGILQRLHIEGFRLDAATFFWCFLVALLLLLVAAIGRRVDSAAIVIASVAASICVCRYAMLQLLKSHAAFPAVNSAVGAAAFFGISVVSETRAVNGAIFIATLVAIAISTFWLAKQHQLHVALSSERTRVRLAYFVPVFILCGWFALPQAAQMLASAPSWVHETAFDSQNVLAWEFLRFHGKLPYRDFWFPYGGLYNRLAPLYPDLLIEFLNDLLLIAIFIWFGLKILRNRIGILLGLLAVYEFSTALHVFNGGASPRYFLCFAAVLMAAVAVEEASALYYGLLGAFFAYVVSQESSQAIYAAPACAVLIGAGVCLAPIRERRMQQTRSLAIGIATGLIGLAIVLGKMGWNGQLAEWWRFISKIGDSAAYGAGRAPIPQWVSLQARLASGALVLVVLLIVGGAVHAIWPICGRRSMYQWLPLSLGVVSLMIFQKQIIRSGMETQFLGIPVLGGVLLVWQRLTALNRQRVYPVAVFCAGFLFCCFVFDPAVWDATIAPQLAAMRRAPQNLQALCCRSEQWARAREAYFLPQAFQFSGFGAGFLNGIQLRERLQSAAPTTPTESIYNLGNDPLLYVMLRKPMPFYSNIYNESPVYAQQKTVDWLQQYQPKYVFWEPGANEFDNVPNQVRVPLLYTYVIEHYRYLKTDGKYDILQRIGPSDHPDVTYWSSKLGTNVDLGYIPATSSLSDGPGGSTTTPLLEVSVASPQRDAQLTLPLRAGRQNWTVAFKELPKKKMYVIRLDRIALLEAERSNGVQIIVGAPPTGTTIRLRRTPVPVEDLY
jgi:hypothetical protein